MSLSANVLEHPNVTVSSHPCLQAKLSQLRSASTTSKETKTLVHEISLLLACEALGKALEGKTTITSKDVTPLNVEYGVTKITSRIVLVPILRSGIAMVDAFQTLLPESVPVYHLGLFRDKMSGEPVEYYNNLPGNGACPYDLAIVVDPVIATGRTAAAAINTLTEWGVKKILVISILGSKEGIKHAADASSDNNTEVKIMVGAVDADPRLGDIGDRLFLTGN
ncbi:uracil phosphoribosyltransferase-domain-containing protein [Pyronema omphalodes]|nr:uracil phosphoribosyltransferase-domain-containing protein [Pyronema omphalodes]